MLNWALIRRQELDRFIEGLFGRADELDLPVKAFSALDELCRHGKTDAPLTLPHTQTSATVRGLMPTLGCLC